MQIPKELPSLVLSQQDRAKIDKLLGEYVKTVHVSYVLLAQKDGQFITKQGASGNVDLETVAALAAGAYMVSWQMARALGKDDFNVVYHEGDKDKVQLSQVDDRTVLAVVFDDRATLGMVRLYAKNLTRQLQPILAQGVPRVQDRAR
ncbi:MAG: roadblock/LC7 domain-containing protein [Planctomycetes bacterium]|nr:roadblock/LC7 domain-containing protein [Planctomycetota bacterium]